VIGSRVAGASRSGLGAGRPGTLRLPAGVLAAGGRRADGLGASGVGAAGAFAAGVAVFRVAAGLAAGPFAAGFFVAGAFVAAAFAGLGAAGAFAGTGLVAAGALALADLAAAAGFFAAGAFGAAACFLAAGFRAGAPGLAAAAGATPDACGSLSMAGRLVLRRWGRVEGREPMTDCLRALMHSMIAHRRTDDHRAADVVRRAGAIGRLRSPNSTHHAGELRRSFVKRHRLLYV
jgi:hypothetical protein